MGLLSTLFDSDEKEYGEGPRDPQPEDYERLFTGDDTPESVRWLTEGVHTLEKPHVGYKGLTKNAIATVIIPKGATVVVPDLGENKVRTDEFYVHKIDGASEAGSPQQGHIRYREGKMYHPDELDTGGSVCSNGLHLCPRKKQAREWTVLSKGF